MRRRIAPPSDAADALDQAWEPFVLVAGLLLIGDAASRDGVFAAAGASLERIPAGGAGLLAACLAPNLFVTGSLSAYLWWQAARGAGAHPTIRGFLRHGLVLAPVAIVGALTFSAAVSAPR